MASTTTGGSLEKPLSFRKRLLRSLDNFCNYNEPSTSSRFLRCICCVKKKDRHNGVHCCGAYCGKPDLCCTRDGCITCSLSHGGRFWISAFCSLVWIFVGGFTFTSLEPDTFDSFSDSVYFSVITITTIGYGDFHPQSTACRAWTFFYAHIGMIIFGFLSTFFAQEFFSFLPLNPDKKVYKNKCRRCASKSPTCVLMTFYITLLLIGAAIFQIVSPPGSFHYTWKNIIAEIDNGTDIWGFSEAFYFSWVTTTTIGYGDVTVQGEWGRFFVEIYAIIGIAMLSLVFGRISYLKDSAEAKLRDMKRSQDNNHFQQLDLPADLPSSVKKIVNVTMEAYHDLKYQDKLIFQELILRLMKERGKEGGKEEKTEDPPYQEETHVELEDNIED